LFSLFAIGAFIFLLWEHFVYKDESPPLAVAVFRDIFGIYLFLMVVGIAIIVGRHVTNKNWYLVAGFILYLVCGAYWGYCHFYYAMGGHGMPSVVLGIKTFCLIYTVTVTIILLFILAAHAPPEIWLCLYLFEA